MKRNRASILPLFFAALMLLGHSLVPHRHSPELYGQQTPHWLPVEVSVWEWMSRSFAVNLGEGHLEHFVAQQEDAVLDQSLFSLWPDAPNFPVYLPVFHYDLLFPSQLPQQLDYGGYRLTFFTSLFFPADCPLRAPPVCA